MATVDTATAAGQPSPSFANWQTSTYGLPQRKRTYAQAQPLQPSSTPYMPNGQPTAQPAPVQQQMYTTQPTQQTVGAGTTDASGVYHAAPAPNYTYTPQQIAAFQAPNTSQMDNGVNSLVQQLLQNPQSLSPQVIAQMKGTQRDQAALLAKQNLGQLQASAGARGIGAASPYMLGQQRALGAQTASDILSGFRGIDINAAQQNRQDLLNAITAGSNASNQQFQRGLQGYQAQLQGQQAAGQEQKSMLDSLMQQYQAGLQGQQLQAQTQQGAIGQGLQQQQIANQAGQFGQTFGLDTQKFDYQKQLDAQQLAQQQAAMGQSADEFNQNLAFQYQQANQSQYNNLLQWLLGSTGDGGGQ